MDKIISIPIIVAMVFTIWFVRSNILQKVIRYIDRIDRKKSFRLVLISLIIIIVSYVIPMFKIEAQYYSVFDFIKQGSVAFSAALIGYILAAILLLINRRFSYIISCGLVIFSWLFSFNGAMWNIPDRSINTANGFIAFASVFILTLFPLVCVIFYNALLKVNTK